ncbi:MAG: hypothetical protein AAGG72_07950 [Pseudomonadota bacterium]
MLSERRCPPDVVEGAWSGFVALLELQLLICDGLEETADRLPDNIDAWLCEQLAIALETSLPLVHRIEEEIILPILARPTFQVSVTRQTVQRLRREHRLDEGYALEICALLRELAERGVMPNP